MLTFLHFYFQIVLNFYISTFLYLCIKFFSVFLFFYKSYFLLFSLSSLVFKKKSIFKYSSPLLLHFYFLHLNCLFILNLSSFLLQFFMIIFCVILFYSLLYILFYISSFFASLNVERAKPKRHNMIILISASRPDLNVRVGQGRVGQGVAMDKTFLLILAMDKINLCFCNHLMLKQILISEEIALLTICKPHLRATLAYLHNAGDNSTELYQTIKISQFCKCHFNVGYFS